MTMTKDLLEIIKDLTKLEGSKNRSIIYDSHESPYR
jgi:hypothetical protein